MASVQSPPVDESDDGDKPAEEEVEELGQEVLADSVDNFVRDVPQPEAPLGDAKHDQTILLLAALVGLGMLVLLLWLNFLSVTGIFGSGCASNLTNRTALCSQRGYSNPDYLQFTATPLIK